MNKLLAALVMLGMSSSAWALEKINFNDNESVPVRLSLENINKIFVSNDAITGWYKPEGYITGQDDDDGAIYAQVGIPSPFTVYLTTEQGHHVSLVVTPVRALGKTIELTPRTASDKARTWEESKGYEKSLLSLMKAMRNQKPPRGYGIQESNPSISSKCVLEEGNLTPKLIYQGVHFTGVIYTLKNEGFQTMVMQESDFDQPGVKGVMLPQQTLGAGQTMTVYEVLGTER